jgi:hypothetical protein
MSLIGIEGTGSGGLRNLFLWGCGIFKDFF